MLKRIVSLLISAILLVSVGSMLVSCKDEEATGINAYATVWSALSTEKYMQSYSENSTNPNKDKVGKTQAKLDFVGMKNETQSMQLMITAKQYIKGFDLDVSDLKTSDGTTFSANNIKVYAEKYVEIYAPYINSAKKGNVYYSDAGYYPDALVPIDRYQKAREDRIEAGHNQGIWVDVEIPIDATAGEYSGNFTLTLADETMNIPVTLKIYNLEMSETVHSKTMFNIWYQELAPGEGDNADVNTNQVYYDFLLSKRLCSGQVNPNYTASLNSFIEHITTLALNERVTSYIVPTNLIGFNKDIMRPQDETSVPEPDQIKEREKLQAELKKILLKVLDKNVSLRESGDDKYKDIDLFKKLYFYYEDEPAPGYRTDRVRIFCEKLALAKKEILDDSTTRAILKQYGLVKSFAAVQEICPSNQVTQDSVKVPETDGVPNYIYYDNETPNDKSDDLLLGGAGLTLWCPEEYKWKDVPFKDEVVRKQGLGETFWWYTCVINSPVMSYYVESIPISMRTYSWMQYELGIEGVLYWDVVHWSGIEGKNPYADVQYNEYGGGEGLLIYPGVLYGTKTPISSIRLEQIRAGQQDYEYLYMLDAYLEANGIEMTAQEIVNKIGKNFYDGAYTLENASETLFEEYRIRILDILQDFANNDVESAKAKINEIK